MGKFNLQDYQTVEDRLKEFWADCPDGRINTDIIERDGTFVTVKATIWKDKSDASPTATGIAYEDSSIGGQPVNKTSHIENCETSAIGRALANMGYYAKARPSREEMEKVERMGTPVDDADVTAVDDLVEQLTGQGKDVAALKKAAHTSAVNAGHKVKSAGYYQHVAGELAKGLG